MSEPRRLTTEELALGLAWLETHAEAHAKEAETQRLAKRLAEAERLLRIAADDYFNRGLDGFARVVRAFLGEAQ